MLSLYYGLTDFITELGTNVYLMRWSVARIILLPQKVWSNIEVKGQIWAK